MTWRTCVTREGRFNLNSVLCGAEGSLGFIVEAKLNVLPIPKYSMLVNVRYAGFMDALRDAKALMAHQAVVDRNRRLQGVAAGDEGHRLARRRRVFPEDAERPTLGINLVEFSGDD